jgi:hypothetical protein
MDLVLIETGHCWSLIKAEFSDVGWAGLALRVPSVGWAGLALHVPSVGWAGLALRVPSLDAVSRSQPISKLASNICLNIGTSGES